MITSADLQNRAVKPETIRGEHAVQAAVARMKGKRTMSAEEVILRALADGLAVPYEDLVGDHAKFVEEIRTLKAGKQSA